MKPSNAAVSARSFVRHREIFGFPEYLPPNRQDFPFSSRYSSLRIARVINDRMCHRFVGIELNFMKTSRRWRRICICSCSCFLPLLGTVIFEVDSGITRGVPASWNDRGHRGSSISSEWTRSRGNDCEIHENLRRVCSRQFGPSFPADWPSVLFTEISIDPVGSFSTSAEINSMEFVGFRAVKKKKKGKQDRSSPSKFF